MGDEIVIRVMEAEAVDVPSHRYSKEPNRPPFHHLKLMLEEARELLPQDAESECRHWNIYDKYLSENNYKDALVFLADLGEIQKADAPFWRKLLNASALLSNIASSPSEA